MLVADLVAGILELAPQAGGGVLVELVDAEIGDIALAPVGHRLGHHEDPGQGDDQRMVQALALDGEEHPAVDAAAQQAHDLLLVQPLGGNAVDRGDDIVRAQPRPLGGQVMLDRDDPRRAARPPRE